MEFAHGTALAASAADRAVRILVALVVLVALAFAAVEVAHSATHDGRCQDLLTSDSPSDYISFEVEGCRASLVPAADA